MIYIDIDGVLADFDGYLQTKNSNALKDTHTLFKTIYKNYEEAFAVSQPLVDLNFLKDIDEFTLLTALPNKNNIGSFTEDVDLVMSTLESNKRKWVKEKIGDCNLIILELRADKSKYCKSPDDVLIDDNKDTGKKWKEKGGKYFTTVEQFLNSGNKKAVKVDLF